VTIQAGILDVLRDLRTEIGMAVLLITHDLGVMADIADRVVVKYAGRTIETAGAAAVFARPSHPYTRGLLDAVPNPARHADGGLREIPGPCPGPRVVAGRLHVRRPLPAPTTSAGATGRGSNPGSPATRSAAGIRCGCPSRRCRHDAGPRGRRPRQAFRAGTRR